MGEAIGMRFNFEDITKRPNSSLSHCLILLAPDEKVESVIEEIYTAYFERGQDIGDVEVLLQIAKKHALYAPDLRDRMTNIHTRTRVLEEVDQAYRMGIRSVPFFLVNHKYAFVGAQPPEVITQILEGVEKGTT